MASPINVLIADDHDIVRYGISSVIESGSNVCVVGEASNGLETVELYKKFRPEVVVLDLSMPQMDGVTTTKKLRNHDSNAHVLILTMHVKEDVLDEVIRAGALGYVLKTCSKSELLEAIDHVAQGKRYFCGEVSNILRNRYVEQVQKQPEPVKDLEDKLTPRELEVLECVGEGLTNQEIGKKLYISKRTVERHRSNIIQKLQLRGGTELVKLAVKHNSDESDNENGPHI